MTAPADTTKVALRKVDLAITRRLLFHDLSDAAKVLAEKAELAAWGGNAGADNLAGDDAFAQFRHNVKAIAQVLDQFGWSVLTDTATIVEHEHLIAARRRAREGGE
jgi:hypothetical protein